MEHATYKLTCVSYLGVFEFEKSLKVFYKIWLISDQGLQNKDTQTIDKRNVLNLQHQNMYNMLKTRLTITQHLELHGGNKVDYER